MRSLLIFLWLLSFGYGFAHNGDEAYFSISVEGDKTVIIAELPWTIRDAINEFDPEAEHTKSKVFIQKTLEDYLAAHLVLSNDNGQILKIIEVKLADNEHEHSHQLSYQITYQGSDFVNVKNDILMSINKKQTNTHRFDGGYFTTTNQSPTHVIIKKENSNLLLIGLVIVVLLLLFLVLRKKKKI